MEAVKFTSPAVVTEFLHESVMRLSLKRAGPGMVVADEISIGENNEHSPIEKSGNLFFFKRWSRIIIDIKVN